MANVSEVMVDVKLADGPGKPGRTSGKRETKKREKTARIRAAATSLFHTRGYRETTIQAISDASKVAPGTLFLYATDKRELLLQIINDELEVLTAHAFGKVDRDAPVLDQLIQVFRPRYEYWGVDPKLSLAALQEVMLTQPGDEKPQSEYSRYQRRRAILVGELQDLLREQQRRGRIRVDEDPHNLAELCMMVHPSFMRKWLKSPAPNVREAMAELRKLLGSAMRGSIVATKPNT